MSDLVKKEFEPIVDVKKLKPEEFERANAIAAQINMEDAQSVVQYGAGAQQKISEFADTILGEIRSMDSGHVGELLGNLSVKVKDLGVDKLSSKESALSKIPFLGDLVDKYKGFISKYDKLNVQIEKIVEELEKSKQNLLRDITLMDTLFDKNRDYIRELDVYIAAGQIKLDEIRNQKLPALKQAAEQSKDLVDAQSILDNEQFLDRFEKKLHDIKLTRTVALQTAPQIRLVQGGNQVLFEKVQSSILNTIPLWKNQIILAISLFRQKKTLELQENVADTTNELLRKNAEMLKGSTLEIAKESERGVVDIETLKQVNDDLISTIEETIQIQKEGKNKRQAVETEILGIENRLKEKLGDIV
ncbi:MAG: toxic anion resistance protein [bacterium]|nr:toxic anion resistance protein [bacterium]